ncbi:DUF1419 domain-containing protein [Rhizobium sp. XQZ8]|uniref:DUF1419 domain-containing protein n=1 Tax=Rhizobium populisoli TaxID=2859785 RepID=UPI001C66C9BF|nr:DUF1419 domain-containing protein [Rhizobium populisoli]MBW6425440.1 DUF1419 domain-containing protein [Rhizobium populisoli]
MYALFNRHAQAPADDESASGSRYSGEWFEGSEGDHDRMFEILPPLFFRGDLFALREFIAARVSFELRLSGGLRHFHGYCDVSDRASIDRMRAGIIQRKSVEVRLMSRAKSSIISGARAAEFHGCGDARGRRRR